MDRQDIKLSLWKLKLLDAFRSLDDAGKIKALLKSDEAKAYKKSSILNLACKVASLQLIASLVEDQELNFDINAQDEDGNTPLHIASMAGRDDVTAYLLSKPEINDTIHNRDLKTPLDVSKTPETAQILQFARDQYVTQVATLLKTYFASKNYAGLEELLSKPRTAALIDINGPNPDTGYTVLQDAIRQQDAEMVKFILAHGGDPFLRDRKGRLPIELAKGNDTIRKILKQSAKEQMVIINTLPSEARHLDDVSPQASRSSSGSVATSSSKIPANIISSLSGNHKIRASNIRDVTENSAVSPLGPPPSMKGYLYKWTNFTSGYKLRWFVLENNVLSYYKSPEDTAMSCRGSLNMKYARLHLDSSEQLKFEIIGRNVSGSGATGTIKYHLKSNHPVETNRWVWALQSAIRNAKDESQRTKSRQKPSNAHHPDSPGHESTGDHAVPRSAAVPPGSASLTASLSHARGPSDSRSIQEELQSVTAEMKGLTIPTSPSVASFRSSLGMRDDQSGVESLGDDVSVVKKKKKDPKAQEGEIAAAEEFANDDYEEDEDEDEAIAYDIDAAMKAEPYSQELLVEFQTLAAQLKEYTTLTMNLRKDIVERGTPLDVDQSVMLADIYLKGLHSFVERNKKISSMISVREKYFRTIIERQQETSRLWEENIRKLELEQMELQKKLEEYESNKKNIRKALLNTGGGTEQLLKYVAPESEEDEEEDEFFDADDYEDADEGVPAVVVASEASPEAERLEVIGEAPEETEEEETAKPKQEIQPIATPSASEEAKKEGETKVAEESVAPEAGEKMTAPSAESNLLPSESIMESHLTEAQRKKLERILEDKSFAGYEDPPRTSLSRSEDDRPSISLWGILKSLIGKDMTRMTLPVSFNECTSLLQRVAEDMEYSDLADNAAEFEDSTLRMVYVAAFAASEYASTIDRIAKPFNPLLGETFEYCRPDKKYRFIVEQVSHHPPISAALAESPKWDYYGESAVKSKFNGRSFDIKPLGTWYLTLRPTNDESGITEETYTWRKLTSSVVGIITGHPVLDNYGTMEIINHATGDKCSLKFKQRGWRTSYAYEVRGSVISGKDQKTKWVIGGRWNDKLFAKRVVPENYHEVVEKRRESILDSSLLSDPGIKEDDSHVAHRGWILSDPEILQGKKKFLIWKANPRPKRPFNLTPFAISLNAPYPKLLEWVAPTDTRLRPDQRAMEDGKYDLAAEEKNRVEEKQRAARRALEAEGKQYKPKFFQKAIHPVTKEEYWQFIDDKYWKMRKEHKLKETGDIF